MNRPSGILKNNEVEFLIVRNLFNLDKVSNLNFDLSSDFFPPLAIVI